MILGLLLSGLLTFVELNCENLFDCTHDAGKADTEYLPESAKHWTSARYWHKLNMVAQELVSCSDEHGGIPDLIALCEVENDSVLHALTHRSLLKNAGYQYLMTSSPDQRGIDVALLYQPVSFRPIQHHAIRVNPIEGMRATRDILYVSGETVQGDTLHVFVVHQPSKFGGEKHSRPFRQAVADRLCVALDSIRTISPHAKVVVAGDFNEDADSPTLQQYEQHGLVNLTAKAMGTNGVSGTYRYRGEWEHIDHILASVPLAQRVDTAVIHSPLFLLEEDGQYGGYRPLRTYIGPRYHGGFSDHLPLIVRFTF